jgi:hypothetical protein
MSMSQYVDMWQGPMHKVAESVRDTAQQVAGDASRCTWLTIILHYTPTPLSPFHPSSHKLSSIPHVNSPVSDQLSEVLMVQYPALRDVIRSVASKVLCASLESCTMKMAELIAREKDPFTLNDFLQQWVNKIKLEKFNAAVDRCFENAKTSASDWVGLKEEIYTGMQQWYRHTHRYYRSHTISLAHGCNLWHTDTEHNREINEVFFSAE